MFILLLAVVTRFAFYDLVQKIELKSYDWRAQMAAKQRKNSDNIVLLVIDDISLQNASSHPELNLSRWPWPRNTHASIIKYLRDAGAKMIIFDILFEGVEGVSDSNKESDDAFIAEMKKSDNVLLGISFSYSKKSLQKYGENQKYYQQNIMKISSNQLKEEIKRFAVHPVVKDLPETINDSIEFYNVTNVLRGLLLNARGGGSVNLPFSSDGIARTVRPLSIFNGNYYLNLPLATCIALKPEIKLSLIGNKFHLGDKVITLDSEGGHYVNWYGPPSTFRHFRALDVILAQKVIESGKKNPLNYENFKDKIVIVGLTATATDILPTPMAGAYPGPEFLATTIDNYLHSDKFITIFPENYMIVITIAICLLIGGLIFWFKSGISGLSVSILMLVIYMYLCVYLFIHNYLWVEIVFPSMLMVVTIMLTFMTKYVTTRKAYEDTYKIATTDGLTGLYNHRYFQESLSVVIQRATRYNYELSLLLIDIDNFKKINDTYGHRAGDKVLKDVSKRLKDNLRITDLIARYGGEEIVVILDNTKLNNAMMVGNKLLSAMNSEPFVLSADLNISVTVSIGIASFPTNATSAPELIEVADQGLYYAKNNGKNRLGFRKVEAVTAIKEEEAPIVQENFVDIYLKLDKDTYDKIKMSSRASTKPEIADWIIEKIKKED